MVRTRRVNKDIGRRLPPLTPTTMMMMVTDVIATLSSHASHRRDLAFHKCRVDLAFHKRPIDIAHN